MAIEGLWQGLVAKLPPLVLMLVLVLVLNHLFDQLHCISRLNTKAQGRQ